MNKCLLGSNESIPRPGFLFQQKVIAKVIAKLEHLDDQERKIKRNAEQKGQLKQLKENGKKEREKETKEEERTNLTKGTYNKIDEMLNWVQNQIGFTSEFQRK